VLASCHALLVPLGAHPGLADFIPSKLYDAMAVGRPVLVAARGETAAIVITERCGLAIEPEDGRALAQAVLELHHDRYSAREMGRSGRAAAVRYLRSAQVARLEEVLSAAAAERPERHNR
jgi:glycosyltransferase involved in cell wall biosynthesis